MTEVDLSLVNWSRAQFALTALYHFLFVPLTIGTSFIIAIMEGIYVKTGSQLWKNISSFWIKLFIINFVIGVSTGVILEFEIGTNWSNYSWIVGDIFGAPLAIEGLMAFFLETAFIAVMVFGRDKVSPKFYLVSTWLVAIGSNLSAYWILIANGWMQNPIGMVFNPDTARHEMKNFFEVMLNPVGISKFLHTIASCYVISALFVVGVSCWFLLKKKHLAFARRSIIIAASFGLFSTLFLVVTGDKSAHEVAQTQPAKLAAMEGIYNGQERTGIIIMGLLNPEKKIGDTKEEFLFKIEAPFVLSLLGYHDINAFVPGINDLVYGNSKRGIMSASEKMALGRKAVSGFENYRKYKGNDEVKAQAALKDFKLYQQYFGYGFLKKPEEIIPPVPLVFYSFHLMVALGFGFLTLFIVVLYQSMVNTIQHSKYLQWAAICSIPLGFIAAEAGWIVAEVGRQPWAIQDILPVKMATSALSTSSVKTTFFLFVVIFTTLLIAEIKIMLNQIKEGPK